MLEPTNFCNLGCQICAHKKMVRPKGHMPFWLYKKIIDNNKNSIRHLDLYVMGEPLLHSQLAQMIEYAKKFDIWVRVYTNGTLVDSKLTKDIIDAGLDVLTFSYDNSYDIHDYIATIVRAKKKTGKHNPCINVALLNSGASKSKKRDIKRGLKQCGVNRIHDVEKHNWPGYNVTGLNKTQNHSYYPCYLPWISMSILWDGKVAGCCDDYDGRYIVGDVRTTSRLEDIWNNQKMQSLRSYQANRQHTALPACKECNRVYEQPFKRSMFYNGLCVLSDHFHLWKKALFS